MSVYLCWPFTSPYHGRVINTRWIRIEDARNLITFWKISEYETYPWSQGHVNFIYFKEILTKRQKLWIIDWWSNPRHNLRPGSIFPSSRKYSLIPPTGRDLFLLFVSTVFVCVSDAVLLCLSWTQDPKPLPNDMETFLEPTSQCLIHVKCPIKVE